MSLEEILNLINLHEEKLCAQLYARADGTMTMEPCREKQEDNNIVRGRIRVTNKER
ncbi:hypothetical protein G7B40_030240 [Aetokthonos hydrillicola Thurmond2011]|jgi:hypothetical protein|uniref:Uncharacterized protein n=1 Tax=Aetokthonos hydrillicola Thurmond2011 TaxID=2712845 RepID=A0AAP5MB35_9CYAN|nr:hypothetical protein [Aetokthonos hydrillicola]MBO3459882.1 hypothetical protein [Aetokthonos hydrillicola CCALA 1050]MBW4583999.1 hypothetical protein [Aetokthonos hydrillicola CCALA 1050]MDR9898805.1 hypothetical protein [Aetokthonos hydrillicola Thurmond2011]